MTTGTDNNSGYFFSAVKHGAYDVARGASIDGVVAELTSGEFGAEFDAAALREKIAKEEKSRRWMEEKKAEARAADGGRALRPWDGTPRECWDE